MVVFKLDVDEHQSDPGLHQHLLSDFKVKIRQRSSKHSSRVAFRQRCVSYLSVTVKYILLLWPESYCFLW